MIKVTKKDQKLVSGGSDYYDQRAQQVIWVGSGSSSSSSSGNLSIADQYLLWWSDQ